MSKGQSSVLAGGPCCLQGHGSEVTPALEPLLRLPCNPSPSPASFPSEALPSRDALPISRSAALHSHAHRAWGPGWGRLWGHIVPPATSVKTGPWKARRSKVRVYTDSCWACVAAEGTGGSKARDKEVLGRDVWTPTWQDADLTGGGLRDPHTEAGRHPRVRKGGGKQPA